MTPRSPETLASPLEEQSPHSQLDESALAQLLGTAAEMRTARDADTIRKRLLTAMAFAAPGISTWLIDELPESWASRIDGQAPFAASASELPEGAGQATITADAHIAVFPITSQPGLAALILGMPLLEIPGSLRALVAILCQEAAVTLELQAISVAADHTEALFETLAQLSASYTDADRVLETIVRRTAELLSMNVAWVMLADEHKARLDIATVVGITSPSWREMTIPIHDLLPGAAIRKRRTVCLRDVQGDEQSKYSRPEGLRTIMCAPMFVEDDLVGVLVAAHREVRGASAEDRRIMEALAGAAALSITNARLYANHQEYAAALQRTQGFQRKLTELMLLGGTLDEVVAEIAKTLNCEVLILDRDLAVLHRSTAPSNPAEPVEQEALAAAMRSQQALTGGAITRLTLSQEQGDLNVAVASLELGGDRSTFVAIATQQAGTAADIGMTEAAVTAIGLELMRDRAAAEAEARVAGGLFRSLLSDEDIDDATIRRRASYLGYELSGANSVIAVALPAGDAEDDPREPGGLRTAVQRAVRRRIGGAAVFEHEDAVFVLLNTPDGKSPQDVTGRCAQIAAELEASGRYATARLASAGPHSDVGGVRRAVEEALHALKVLAITGEPRGSMAFEELGVWALLGAMGDRDRLRAFAEGVIGTLLAYDDQRHGHLVNTIRALVQCNFQLRATAEKLYIHPNTLRYRIQRIAELSGLDFSNPDDRLRADIALRVLDIEGPAGA